MKLNDSAIAQIAKSLQVAILTGTDIVDNLRTLEFVEEDNLLVVESTCLKNFENNINALLNEATQGRD
jgi:hypothetical protein